MTRVTPPASTGDERRTAKGKIWNGSEFEDVEFRITEEQYKIFSSGIGNEYSIGGLIADELHWVHDCPGEPKQGLLWSRFCPSCGTERKSSEQAVPEYFEAGVSVINGTPGTGEYVYLDRHADGSVTWRPYEEKEDLNE